MNNKILKIIIGILIIGLISLYFIINPSTVDFLPKCPIFQMTDLHCPGCGSQRAVHDILHLNLLDAFSHNALLVITLFGGLVLFLFSKKRFSKLIYHPKSPYIFFAIIVVFWIIRNIPISPFSYLAP